MNDKYCIVLYCVKTICCQRFTNLLPGCEWARLPCRLPPGCQCCRCGNTKHLSPSPGRSPGLSKRYKRCQKHDWDLVPLKSCKRPRMWSLGDSGSGSRWWCARPKHYCHKRTLTGDIVMTCPACISLSFWQRLTSIIWTLTNLRIRHKFFESKLRHPSFQHSSVCFVPSRMGGWEWRLRI